MFIDLKKSESACHDHCQEYRLQTDLCTDGDFIKILWETNPKT